MQKKLVAGGEILRDIYLFFQQLIIDTYGLLVKVRCKELNPDE